ncbi:hypothetical protein [Floricoccus penangensis]|uniref:hypothetical protein n=1 Tax=Floricoccus penangensis TaxID=1859475 RepID=UPI00203E460B|nr:hypothetical protein [Floricoccus penangensis]URZ87551.1 hypothetical protein KIW23_00435 [Floricoccus penangensis]
MKFRKFLLDFGLSKQIIHEIIHEMGKNNFYIVKEENLEIRYKKIKKQRDIYKYELEKSNTQLIELKKILLSNE